MSEPVPTVAVDRTRATDITGLLAEETSELDLQAIVAGRYRVDSLLGTGGMAHVVRATDLVLDREVAVKLLRETTDAEGDLDRFLAETRTLARLSHPGLVTLLDGGTTASDRPYLVMELVDGPALSASLAEPLDPVRVAGIGSQVAAALAYAHTQGVVHRDVKPGNVLLRGDGRVKLADFGIAKLLGDHSLHTKTGTVLGSVHYLAPEQVAFEAITPAVDVYALGLLMLRCLTGHHAFEGPTIESALARLSADPDVPADLPSEWRELLCAMTARVPSHRPTAADVAGRLAALGGARTAPRVIPPAPANDPGAGRAPRFQVAQGGISGVRFRATVSPLAAAAALLAVVLLVAAVLAGGGAASDAPPAAQQVSRPDAGTTDDAGAEQLAGQAGSAADAVVVADVAPADPRPKAKAEKPKKDKAKPGKGHGKGHGKSHGKGHGKGQDKPGKERPGKGKPGRGK